MVAALVGWGERPVDVHLMIDRPDLWAPRFSAMGVRSVAFHIEAASDPIRVAGEVRRAEAFVAFRPETPIDAALGLFNAVDGCLLLTAPAGGRALDARALDKAFALPEHLLTIVDGRIDETHVERLWIADITDVVVGQSLFDGPDPAGRSAALARRLVDVSTDPSRRRRIARHRSTDRN